MRQIRRAAFSLAELLVVIGIVALLIAITLPPLQHARNHAIRTRCASHLQQLGRALNAGQTERNFFPLPDDNGSPIRYTWIDVLIQQRLLGDSSGKPAKEALSVAYCPADKLPDPLNTARNENLFYPPDRTQRGIDYSYGIGVPLASGGWVLRTPGSDGRIRRFRDHDRNISGRVLAGDGYDSGLINLSGGALLSGIWNDQTQFDNTVAWRRHASVNGQNGVGVANLLFQDFHVATARYDANSATPINTSSVFLWQPGEAIHQTPDDRIDDLWYPNQAPPHFSSIPAGNVLPDELNPYWYTNTHNWTIVQK